jgi:hypothetical protein
MLIDHKWMQAVVAVIALSSAQAYAAETEEDNYYLSKMKAMSKTSTPEQEVPAAETDVLAGNDIKSLAEEESLAEMEMKPEFKPAISEINKPKL